MQVKVTAQSTLAKKEKADYLIFTLEIVVNNNIVEDEIKEEEKIGFITIIGIVVGCVLLLALLLLIICLCFRKRGSWTVWKSKTKAKKERVKVEISNQDTSVDKPEMVWYDKYTKQISVCLENSDFYLMKTKCKSK